MNDLNLSEIENLAKKMRISAIETGYHAYCTGKNSAHFGGALSSIEILACLYGGIMDINPQNSDKPHDIFLMSKGHGVLALYTALAHKNFFPLEKLETFETNESELSGHVTMNPEIGMELSSGSLGMDFLKLLEFVWVGVKKIFRKKFLFFSVTANLTKDLTGRRR